MVERRASMNDLVRRGDIVQYIRDNISLGMFMKRSVAKADEACWELCDKLNFVPPIITDEPYKDDCTGCRFVGTYDTEFPCANCTRKTKDYYTVKEASDD